MSERKLPKLKDQSAAYKLFNYPFMWAYAENESYDENDTEYFGRLSSGNKELDFRLATAPSERYITTDEAAELAGRGVSVSLVDPLDSVVIYKLISEHLRDWYTHLGRPGSFSRTKDVPVEGLREFNTLARHLVTVGRRYNLLDQFDPYKKERERRSFSIGYLPKVNKSALKHTDDLFNSIVSYSKERLKERK